jgi:transposase
LAETIVQHSFAGFMQTASTIEDYKILYDELQVKYEAVLHELAQFKKMVFGSKSERFVSADENKLNSQLSLDLDAETIATCKITATTKVSYERTKTEVIPHPVKTHPGRMKLPDHLRREVILLQPETNIEGLKKIGDEVSEVLSYIPGELYVKQYIRPKYVSPLSDTDNTIITASLPGRLLEKCMAGEELLAQITVDKYVDHMPLHRQSQRFQRAGVIIAQSTICGWMMFVLINLIALYELHKELILSTGYLHADETPLKVLDENKKGQAHQGYYWVYQNSEQKLVLFDYRPGRGREGPDDILKDYKGFLQTDGYAVYDAFDTMPGIILVGCLAHARRKFTDALQNDKARAEYALTIIGQLYAIERRIDNEGLAKEGVLQVRQKEAVPILEKFKEWMIEEYPKILPKSVIGLAMAYCLRRWDKLIKYTTSGRLKIDNNPVENSIRPVAIGRKNYLFAGSHEAAQRAAMVYSLFATCRLHQINPYDWLKDVLKRMHLYTTTNMAELLPQNWKKTQT